MKILIGVHHSDEVELEKVIKEIRKHSPKSVGLELPADYKKREEIGIEIGFFSQLSKQLENKENKNIEVIPLVDSETWNTYSRIDMALCIVEGRIERKDLEEQLAQWRLLRLKAETNPYAAPELIPLCNYQIKKYEDILKLLENPPEKVKEMWEECTKRVNENMLKNIRKYKPDIVVIGDGHASEIRKSLREYQYVNVDFL